jgi:hypothetical protein
VPGVQFCNLAEHSMLVHSITGPFQRELQNCTPGTNGVLLKLRHQWNFCYSHALKQGEQIPGCQVNHSHRSRTMKVFSRTLALMFLLVISAAAQDPRQTSQLPPRTILLDIDVLDVTTEHRADIERTIKDKRTFDRLVADGKIHLIAGVQIRTRSGEQASSRSGQRVPIQTATTAQSAAQMQYENTGLSVDVSPKLIDTDRISISLKIDLNAVVKNENSLSPAFLQRTISDVVNIRNGETAIIVSVSQQEGLIQPNKPKDQAESFVIAMTARLLD